MNSNEFEVKRDGLYAILDELASVAVAYSGGVDSTYLLAACLEVLGPDQVLAVTADSPTYPAGEKAGAQKMAQQLGVRLRLINTKELDDPCFASNPPDRCYYCKAELFREIWQRVVTALKELGYTYITLDLAGFRTGSMNEVL